MTDIVQQLRAVQLGDSLLPVGSFAFSNGIETAAAEGAVHDADTLTQYIEVLVHQASCCDGVAVLHAHRAALRGDFEDGVQAADDAVWEHKMDDEARVMTARMGRKLIEMALRWAPDAALSRWLERIKAGAVPGTYPAGMGLVMAQIGCDEEQAYGVHQYGVVTMALGAALRLVRVDHLQTQKILFDANGTAAANYARAKNLTLGQMSNFAPMFDIFAAVHMRAYVRMFMN